MCIALRFLSFLFGYEINFATKFYLAFNIHLKSSAKAPGLHW